MAGWTRGPEKPLTERGYHPTEIGGSGGVFRGIPPSVISRNVHYSLRPRPNSAHYEKCTESENGTRPTRGDELAILRGISRDVGSNQGQETTES